MKPTKRLAPALVTALCALLVPGYAAAGIMFFIDDVAGFNAAVAGFNFQGTEDFESSTLATGTALVDDPLAPGVANGPFPAGTNPATGLTVQANTLTVGGGVPLNPSPRGLEGLVTAPSPNDQVSNNFNRDSFDMLFSLPDTAAVSFNPLVFDNAFAGDPSLADIRVFDTSNTLLNSALNVNVAGFLNPTTFVGVVAMVGDDIGRINVFATATGFDFSGADNISVYTRQQVPPGIPEPGTLALLGLGLAGVGLARRKR